MHSINEEEHLSMNLIELEQRLILVSHNNLKVTVDLQGV